MYRTAMTLGDELLTTADTFGVINPATGKVFAEAPECTEQQLDNAMDAATMAFAEWRKETEETRRDSLKRAAQAIKRAQDELAEILSLEQGKPIRAAAYEVSQAALWLEASADLLLPREIVQDDESGYAEVVRRPLGVVAAITPWNFPLLLAGWKIGPALIAGNTVVLKPSPYTPLSTLKVGEILASVLPPGVVNVVSGGDELGAWMTDHSKIRKISFTGSVETGKAIAAVAAPDLKRVTLELGGNDAAIVLDDADPEAISKGIFWGAFINCGQICAGIKRVYVPDALHDDLVEALAARARKARVGEGTREGVQLGPINNKPQYERVVGLVDDALANGATAVAGGKAMDGDGYFFEPTILTGVSEGTRIVDEEQFGPVLPIIPYRELDDAIERANATDFGLAGSVWSPNLDQAADVASRLDCGTAYINSHLAIMPHLPFGGVKWSGLGVENGHWGLDEFTELQVLYTARS